MFGRIVRGVRLIAALLGAMLVVLLPLAHARPVDPSTPGFWDDADYDDVVLFLTADLHFLHPAGHQPAIRLFVAPIGARATTPARPVPLRPPAPTTPRAPPSAS